MTTLNSVNTAARQKAFDLLSFGEILLRMSPPGNERIVRSETFDKQIGGAELNVATAVSLLGLRTGIISRVPCNTVGIYARNKLRFGGVSDDYLLYDRSADARLGIYFYESGAYPRKPQIVYDRAGSSITRIRTDAFEEGMFRKARCFHTSGITLALSPACRQAGMEMIRRFKENGTLISFDVNFRSNLWTGAEAKTCIEEILPYVDIFFCSEDTARLTFGKEGTLEEIMKSFAAEYPLSVIASTQRTVHSPKVHSFTSLLYEADTGTFYEEEPYENIEVVDRIGSGDAYVGGALYGLLKPGGNCLQALRYGNACSAAKNTIPGDLPSLSLDETDDIISDHLTKGFHSEMKR